MKAEQPLRAGPLTFCAVRVVLRAEGVPVRELPECLELVHALPRGGTLRKGLTYKLCERYSGTVK